MLITSNLKMADLIHHEYRLVTVLNRFGIPLGFGDATIETICEKYGVNAIFFLEIVNISCNPDYFPKKQLLNFPVGLIINYLRNSHHYYIHQKIPQIERAIRLLVEQFGKENKNLYLIRNFFEEYRDEIFRHTTHEDMVIFPYAFDVEKAFKTAALPPHLREKIGQHFINEYARHHSNLEVKLLDLKNIMIKYLQPPSNSQLYNTVLFELFKLEKDLNQHALIEDKVLVPKISAMEKDLKHL